MSAQSEGQEIHVGRDAYIAGRDLTVNAGWVPPPRSAYRQQVRRVAPAELLDRDAELAELATFCVAPAGPRWVWWQAPAWSGKSALMAWFVLHPPPGIRVVSFFVTARWAGQSDQGAFADVVLEQLAELADQPLPQALTAATREPHLLEMLEVAAQVCAHRGERLVLVVDGLDEDRGVTVGPDTHSIAAMLPVTLPEGVRVVVAGRPNPPVPADVPENHPLREPNVVRPLEPSPVAQVIKADAQRELKHLLHGTPAEQDLLGLVAAAGGGLSGGDLAELTGWPVIEIEEQLSAVSGRTFSKRGSRWQPENGPEIFVLAHEELQNAATAYLGGKRLDAYRERLHTWAVGYRDRGWPEATPEYLLRGYFRLLRTVGNTSRMVVCATDQIRQDRMLHITGGDVAALAEIATVLEIIFTSIDPDPLAMLRLAIAHVRLSERNDLIPVRLPAVWATLGDPARAEALARSIGSSHDQDRAVVALVRAVAAAGDLDHAEALARSIVHRARHSLAMVELARAVAVAGDLDRAEALAQSIGHRAQRAEALAALTVAAMSDPDRARGFADEAEGVARSLTQPHWRAQTLIRLAETIAPAGLLDRARGLIDEAETFALSSTGPDQTRTLVELVGGFAAIGDLERAESLARSIADPSRQVHAVTKLVGRIGATGDLDRAEALADSLTDLPQGATALVELAGAVAAAGDLVRAEAVVRSIPGSYLQAEALVEVATAVTAAGDLDRARELIRRAEAITRSMTESHEQADSLVKLAEALALTGDLDQAEALVRLLKDPHEQEVALVELARAVAATGDLDRAETLARSITQPHRRAKALAGLTGVIAAAGDLDRAESIARSIPFRAQKAYAMAEAATAAKDSVRARRLVAEAEALTRSLTQPYRRSEALVKLVVAVATGGDPDRAESLAHAIPHPPHRAQALVELTKAAGAAGDLSRAEALACSITHPYHHAEAMVELTGAVAVTGDLDRAISLAQSITDGHFQAVALILVAETAEHRRAHQLLALALRSALASWTLPLRTLAKIDPAVVRTLARDFLAGAS